VKNYIDLHMHSEYSDDGEFTPIELVRMCHQAKIRMMAITDHNSVKATSDAQQEADKLNIRYIPAIEIDCTCKDMNLHLLGYNINYKSSDFETVENNIRKQCADASVEMLRLIRLLGFDVSEDELNAIVNKNWKEFWAGEKFAEILLNKPKYHDNELLRPYRHGGEKSDNPYVNFYWDYFDKGKPCYAKIVFPSIKDVVSIIKDNGGKAVLAHPGKSLGERFEMLDEIIKYGIDGLEAFSSYHDERTARYFCSEASKNRLFVTCGSDFHGKIKPAVHLGESGCFIPDSEIECSL
jgi:predicted metal-dependent phosphoesterase TrpH